MSEQSDRDRRTGDRLEVLLPVDYYTDRNKIHKFYLASNISDGGMFINTYSPFKIGDELDVILCLFDNAEPEASPRRFVVHGQVRHVKRTPMRSDDGVSGMGIQWVDMDSKTWGEMSGVLHKQMGAHPGLMAAKSAAG